MAVSKTTFSQRMSKIESGQTTSWTVPGQGLAEVRDERRFLAKANLKMLEKSTRKKVGLILYVCALVLGAVSVVAARWIDFRFLDSLVAYAALREIDLVPFLSTVPTAFVLALVLALLTLVALGFHKSLVPLHAAGFLGATLYEAELVALAPALYAQLYPSTWVADMIASATLVT